MRQTALHLVSQLLILEVSLMRWANPWKAVLACILVGMGAGTMFGGSSLSNSLTGFSGDSTQGAAQAALGTAGLNIFSTAGPEFGTNDNGTPDDTSDDFQEQVGDDTITFDGMGTHFGTVWAGDGGRNYIRTNDSDYATVKFQAEITFETTSDDQAVFFGLGAGDRALFGTPDWSTQFSSASFWPETANDKFVRFRTANDVNAFGDSTVAGFDPGVHRFRMKFDPVLNQLQGEIDINYAGGPFVADAAQTNFPIGVGSLFAADGWPSEPSRIFFGGDDGATFRDLSIVVVPEPATGILLLVGPVAIWCRRRINL